jgi:AcrR family transcriptional regulator
MSTGPLSRQERKELTRRALLDSARKEVAKHGMAGARVDEIAAGAGVTVGAVYSNFADKAGLLFAMFDDTVASSAPAPTDLSRDCHSVESLLSAVAETFRRVADDDPDLIALQLELFGYVLRDPHARERRVEVHRAGISALAQRLTDEATAAGAALPMPADQLAELALTTFWALALSRTWLGKDVISDSLFTAAARQLTATRATTA